MASTELVIGVQVELEVGEKTADWLKSLGWKAPIEEERLGEAQHMYLELLKEIGPPNDRLLRMLELLGIDTEELLRDAASDS
jgi:uroporphyrinogen-III synthase